MTRMRVLIFEWRLISGVEVSEEISEVFSVLSASDGARARFDGDDVRSEEGERCLFWDDENVRRTVEFIVAVLVNV